MLTIQDIMKYIDSHQDKIDEARKYREFEQGLVPTRREGSGSLGKGSKNEVAINFARNQKDIKVGYMHSIPFTISYPNKEDIQKLISSVFAHNNINKLSLRTGEEMNDVGYGYWLLYINDEKELKIRVVPMEEIILIKEPGLSEVTKYGIRHYQIEDIDGNVTEKVELYTRSETYYYTAKEGQTLELEEFEADENGIKKMNPSPNFFGRVPIVEFENNGGKSEFVDIYEITLLYNRLFNALADEEEDIGNVILKIINGEFGETQEERTQMIEDLRRLRVLAINSTKENPSDVGFMNKNANTQSARDFLESVRSLIFEIGSVPDIKTLTANTRDLSGRTITQMMKPLENRCVVKEANMRSGILYFLRLFISYVKFVKPGLELNLEDFDIFFRRNASNSITIESVNDLIALKSNNILPQSYLLSLLPNVGNPAVIMTALNSEGGNASEMEITAPNAPPI